MAILGEYGHLLFLSDILLNNPRNQPHCHVPVGINPRNHETDIILLAGHPVVIAAVRFEMNSAVSSSVQPRKSWVSQFPMISCHWFNG